MRWTDDTQMSLDFAESLLALGHLDADDLAGRFARSYRYSRGYGPGTAKILGRVSRGKAWKDANRSVYPQGSYGNGAAMRAAVASLFFFRSPEQRNAATELAASVTHAHPAGIEGAVLIATAVFAALSGGTGDEILDACTYSCRRPAFLLRLQRARAWREDRAVHDVAEIRHELGNGTAAVDSCVTALYLALRFGERPFLDLINFVARCGGDVDTIGAMAGAIWGAMNGARLLPASCLARLEDAERIRATASKLWAAAQVGRVSLPPDDSTAQ